MTADPFSPPEVPRVDNSSGDPQPPSGLHPVSDAPTVFIETGPDWSPEHPAGAGTNIHDSPSGSHAGGSDA
jgi:hypothetical protein